MVNTVKKHDIHWLQTNQQAQADPMSDFVP